jgi:hypothetical protein
VRSVDGRNPTPEPRKRLPRSHHMSDLAFQISLLLCSLVLLAGMAAGMLAIPRLRVELEPVRAEHDPLP